MLRSASGNDCITFFRPKALAAATAFALTSTAYAAVSVIVDGGDSKNVPTDYPSPWQPDFLYVGYVGMSGQGSLTVSNGARADVGRSTVGFFPGAEGFLTVTGANTHWSTLSRQVIGSQGTGHFELSGGALAEDRRVTLGSYASGVGIGVVSGANTRWNIQGNIMVGSRGQGELLIENGAVLHSQMYGFIGEDRGSQGELTVRGIGSRWVADQDTLIGDRGQGSLLVEDGGVVQIARGMIGRAVSGQGDLTMPVITCLPR